MNHIDAMAIEIQRAQTEQRAEAAEAEVARLRSALAIAREFVDDELSCRKVSFNPDPRLWEATMISDAESVISIIDTALEAK
jgi:hypothetical protein